MNLRDASLSAIEKGEWTFDVLAPQFEAALIKRVQGRNPSLSNEMRSLMEWTLLAYQTPSPDAQDRIMSEDLFIDPARQPETIQRALSKLAESTIDGAQVSTFTEGEKKRIRRAIQLIQLSSPQTWRAFERWITHFLKFENVPFRSASHPHAFGCIFLNPRLELMSDLELSTSIVHEMGHQDLFLLNIIDRLIQVPADYKLAHAPFQERMRPPIGRLHSYFALFRMIQFQDQNALDSNHYRNLFEQTRTTFADDELTPFGFQIVEAVAQYLIHSRRVAGVQLA